MFKAFSWNLQSNIRPRDPYLVGIFERWLLLESIHEHLNVTPKLWLLLFGGGRLLWFDCSFVLHLNFCYRVFWVKRTFSIPKIWIRKEMNLDDDASMDDVSFKTIHSKKKLEAVRKGRVVPISVGPEPEVHDNGDFFLPLFCYQQMLIKRCKGCGFKSGSIQIIFIDNNW